MLKRIGHRRRILGGGGGGGQDLEYWWGQGAGANSQQAHDVVLTSMNPARLAQTSRLVLVFTICVRRKVRFHTTAVSEMLI